jgi:TolB-like protein/class 3 adenylate cyclase
MEQDRPVRVERRLTAILAADVAAYSRLMHSDEEGTHAKLTTLLTDAVNPAIAEHGGRIVKNTGDGFLAEFPSAVKAVRAAVQFQSRVNEIAAYDAEHLRIAFRVGVNIGDVIVEPHDIFGDGVNIAARLESIAKPGGICISSSAYDQVRGKVAIAFADLGEQSLKNIDLPVRVYSVVWDGDTSTEHADSAKLGKHTPPRLSLVVLPFINLSGDPKQDYFVDGVTESITADISRLSHSFVIGRHTAFTYKGKAVDLRQIGSELNVKYALEGSVQRSGDRLRVNVQLIGTETGTHLWTDRFENSVTDMFEMQDAIVSRLANALKAKLIVAEARRVENSTSPDATDLNFQGTARLYKASTAEHLNQARGFFERALAIDPRSVGALLGIATVNFRMASGLLADDRLACFSAAETKVIEALSIVPHSASAHTILGGIYIYTNRAAQGIHECKEALRLDRNAAYAHANIGLAKYYIGRAAETEVHMLEALRLSPHDSGAPAWMNVVGVAKIQLSADTEAAEWLRRSTETNRNIAFGHFGLAAALGLLGALKDARDAVDAGLSLDPTFTIQRILATQLSDNATYLAGRQRIVNGMRLAGVPQG